MRSALSFAISLALSATFLAAQKYDGPRPPKPDVPYLLHADNLVPTEVSEAKEQDSKDSLTYVVPGASSPAKTPLASPIFLLQTEKLDPAQLQLYRLETNGSERQIEFSKKKSKKQPRPYILSVRKISSDNIYRLEVDESLDDGEYSLTPSGSNQVFCFQVY